MIDYKVLLAAERKQEEQLCKILAKIEDYDAAPLDLPIRELLELCAEKIRIFEELTEAFTRSS